MKNNTITYIEFQAPDLKEIKKFYKSSFDWKFEDFWDSYTAFSHSGVKWWFEKSLNTTTGIPLIILYHKNLEKIQWRIEKNGGVITKDIFTFPGGRRFEFQDPAGNSLAVWSDKFPTQL